MKSLFFGFLMFFSVAAMGQENEDKILWQENSKLSWNDFRGEVPENYNYHANTSSGMTYSFSFAQGPNGIEDFKYEVYSTFNPYKSWVKLKDASAHLLAHEQLHFDISELHARILKMKISKYHPTKNAKDDLKQMYEETKKMREKMQTLFDEETQHSMNKQESAKWQKLVERELKKYEKYSS